MTKQHDTRRPKGFIRRNLTEALSFIHIPVPPGPPAYRSAGYALKTLCWVLAVALIFTLVAVLIGVVVLGSFVFITMLMAVSGDPVAGMFLAFVILVLIAVALGAIPFILTFAIRGVLLLVLVGVYKGWTARLPRARTQARVVGGIGLLLGALVVVYVVGAFALEAATDGSEGGIAFSTVEVIMMLVFIVVGAWYVVPSMILVVAPGNLHVIQHFKNHESQQPGHLPPQGMLPPPVSSGSSPTNHRPNKVRSVNPASAPPNTPAGRTPQKKYHPWDCPGCKRRFRVPRIPPVPPHCPTCRSQPK